MRYLYGDSSPFPLNQNFLDTLAAATDTCVALLAEEEATARSTRIRSQVDMKAMAELADIDQLRASMETALRSHEGLSPSTRKLVDHVVEHATKQFDAARAGVKAWHERMREQAAVSKGESQAIASLDRFLTEHKLPGTSWGLRWKAGRGDELAVAHVYATMPRGLAATFEVTMEEGQRWAESVRVSELFKGVAVQMLGKDWLGRPRLKDEALDRHFIVRVTRTDGRHAFVLGQKATEPSEGLKIVMLDGDDDRVQMVRVDEHERALGEPAVLMGSDRRQMEKLWALIIDSALELVDRRSALHSAELYCRDVREIDSPATVAYTLIAIVAPIVRRILKHGRTAGELSLKRELGDGRREELFIARETITGKWASLSEDHRELFDAYGLTPKKSKRPRREVAKVRPAAGRPPLDGAVRVPTPSWAGGLASSGRPSAPWPAAEPPAAPSGESALDVEPVEEATQTMPRVEPAPQRAMPRESFPISSSMLDAVLADDEPPARAASSREVTVSGRGRAQEDEDPSIVWELPPMSSPGELAFVPQAGALQRDDEPTYEPTEEMDFVEVARTTGPHPAMHRAQSPPRPRRPSALESPNESPSEPPPSRPESPPPRGGPPRPALSAVALPPPSLPPRRRGGAEQNQGSSLVGSEPPPRPERQATG